MFARRAVNTSKEGCQFQVEETANRLLDAFSMEKTYWLIYQLVSAKAYFFCVSLFKPLTPELELNIYCFDIQAIFK